MGETMSVSIRLFMVLEIKCSVFNRNSHNWFFLVSKQITGCQITGLMRSKLHDHVSKAASWNSNRPTGIPTIKLTSMLINLFSSFFFLLFFVCKLSDPTYLWMTLFFLCFFVCLFVCFLFFVLFLFFCFCFLFCFVLFCFVLVLFLVLFFCFVLFFVFCFFFQIFIR